MENFLDSFIDFELFNELTVTQLVFITAIFLFITYNLIDYILFGISASTLAHKNNLGDKSWFAWIPILRYFLLPLMAEDKVTDGMKGKVTKSYGILLLVSIVLFVVPMISIFPKIIIYISFYHLIKDYTHNRTKYLVITVFTYGLAIPYLLFRIRNRQPLNQENDLDQV